MKLSRYNYIKHFSNEWIGIYNTAANTISFVDGAEFEKLQHATHISNNRYYESGICIDDNIDEVAKILELERLASETDFDVRMYTILTTTACNASCAYCYESLWPVKSIDDETAKSIAEFILSDSKDGDEIHLWWFGGEPLMNMRPIKIITSMLQADKTRNIYSKLTTNGSLITSNVASELWRLGISSIQVTVDGLKTEHDEIKNFSSVPPNSREIKSDSSFEGLIHSIDLLIDQGIEVQVRVNTGKNYRDCIPNVLSYFETRFPKKQLSLYFEPIDSLSKNNNYAIPENDLRDFYTYSIYARVSWNGFKQPEDLLYPYLTTYCGACIPYLRKINPDGGLGKCHRDLGFIKGNIYCNQYTSNDENYYDFHHPAECLECIFLPSCHGGCQYKARYADYKTAKCCPLKYDIDARLEYAFKLFEASL